MIDSFGRTIDYMRVSITDRCNLRCTYCMPNGICKVTHDEILRYDEILRICNIATSIGITKFKITGGEPLVRHDCATFVRQLKQMNGVQQVTLTTNGQLLDIHLDALLEAGIDAINISLDTCDPTQYNAITGNCGADVAQVLSVLRRCVSCGVRTKVNVVLLTDTLAQIIDLASLAAEMSVDVRFIERMPIGVNGALGFLPMKKALERLKTRWSDLNATDEKCGNGPAQYYQSKALKGRIGFIGALSHSFCEECNRVRLTSRGILKPCLCFENGADLRMVLRSGGTDEQLRAAFCAQIDAKPSAHCFEQWNGMTERRAMYQIGG